MAIQKKPNRVRKVRSLTLSDSVVDEADALVNIGAYQSRSQFFEDAGKRRIRTIKKRGK